MNKEEYGKFKNIFYPTLIIFLAALIRIFPHTPNFVPISAMALFGGAYLSKRYAFIIPLLTMFVSDLFLGLHQTMIFVYVSFILIVVLGILIKKNINIKTLFFASLISSVSFFLITNFGVWAMYNFYPKNINGLLESYVMGIPFFKNTIQGDFLYTALFFGSFEFVKKLFLEKKLAKQ